MIYGKCDAVAHNKIYAKSIKNQADSMFKHTAAESKHREKNVERSNPANIPKF